MTDDPQPAPRLFVTDYSFAEPDRDRLRSAIGAECALFVTRGELRDAFVAHPEADVLCTLGPPRWIYDEAHALRWIALSSAGADYAIEHGLVRPHGPVVTTASGVHAAPISEHVFALLLMWVRSWPTFYDLQRRGEWPAERWSSWQPRELHGATLGVIGLGAIGREVARIGRSFGMRVLAMRHGARADEADADADELYPPERLHDLLARVDYAVIAAPATAATHHLIDAAALASMKPDAFLVNIARGSLVDEQALVAALESGRLGGAGLDVFEHEPLPPESPLWRLPNVILSPHVAGLTDQYSRRLTDLLLDNLAQFRAGQPLRNVVDPTRGY